MKTFFENLHWNIKLGHEVISFPKLKLHVESPKVMVNKCVVKNCSTSYKTGQKKALFHFHEDQEFKRKWIYFANHKDWLPTAHSVIRISHFEENFIKRGRKCINSCALAISSSTFNYNDSKSNLSLLSTPTIPRKSPRKRKIEVDELVLFQATDEIVDIDSISEQNSPENFTFKRLDNSVQLLDLKCIEETGILAVHECIKSPCSFIISWFSYKLSAMVSI